MTPLRPFTLWRVFWRSLFLQAGFNPQSMQSLGLVYALQPALAELYPDEARRTQAVERHFAPFNTHPYFAAAIVGGVLFHEIRIARGESSPEAVVHFKKALMGPLAALGDGFFWHSLRPAAGALACALVPFVGAWAGVVFLVAYNFVHLWLRARLFKLGLLFGDALVSRLQAPRLTLWGQRLRWVAAGLAGGLAAWLAMRFGAQVGGGFTHLTAASVCLLLGALALWLVERGVSRYLLLYLMALLAVTIGATA